MRLEYSTDAENVRAKFLRAQVIVYVEGDDDVVFWGSLFESLSDIRVAVESCGGSPEVEKYAGQIKRGELVGIAARDSDHNRTLGRADSHPLLVYTHGYSIENCTLSRPIIEEISKLLTKRNPKAVEKAKNLLDLFEAEIEELVVLDLMNEAQGLGISVLGDKCERLAASSGARICPLKKESKVQEVMARTSTGAVALAEQSIKSAGVPVLSHVRGHFLMSWALRMLRSLKLPTGRQPNLTTDALFALAVSTFEKFLLGSHPSKIYYERVLADASNYLRKQGQI